MIKTHDLCFALSQTLGKDGVEVRRSRMVVPFADTVLYLWVPQAPRFLLAHVVILIFVVVISLSGFLLVSFSSLCMYMYVCIYIYTCKCVYVCLSVCMHVRIYTYTLFMSLFAMLSMLMYIFTHNTYLCLSA